MKSTIFRTSILGLAFGAIVTIGGLSACSNNTQTSPNAQTPTTQSPPASGSPTSGVMPGMDHSTMPMDQAMMNMDLGPADENYDLRFIDAMRLHHRGAIEMAKQAEQKSKRPEIQTLARDIIVAQNREENELLAKWRKEWYPNARGEFMMYGGGNKSTMPMSNEYRQMMSMQQDLGSADDQFDLRFMNAMIPHHEGAIAMAKDALQKSKRPEVKQLAQEIVTSQQKEVDQMKQWRKAWYNQ